MSEISSAIDQIRAEAARHGLTALAREAGVPYTTVHSFDARDWQHKNLEVIAKLSAAAKRLAKRTPPEKP